MQHKSSVRFKVEDGDAGTVSVVFSTLGVIDSDQDVTLPGAFENGAKTRISAYGHESWLGALPVGKGTIHEVKDEAIFNGQFFMDTQQGRDTFATIKAMGDMQEWSYGYDAVEYKFGDHEDRPVRFLEKVKVHEISPVLIGAGVNTRTLVAKGLSLGDIREFKAHGTAVLAVLAEFEERAGQVRERRLAEGKSAMSDEYGAFAEEMKAAMDRLYGLTVAPDPVPDDAYAEVLRYYRTLATTRGWI